MRKIFLSGAFFLSGAASAASADPAYFWFKNEVKCNDAVVTVRSYCQVSDRPGAVIEDNSMCPEQEIRIERVGKKAVRQDLHARKTSNYLLVHNLTCVQSHGRPYLYVGMDNGGSCSTCESDGVLDFSGHWKRDGKRWYTSGAERRNIALALPGWQKLPAVFLNNTVRDSEED